MHAFLLIIALIGIFQTPTKNGFVLSYLLIPLEEILSGGPPRDGIPAINNPKFLLAENSTLGKDALVIGLANGDEAKAYPINIMNWHEIVNDEINGIKIYPIKKRNLR